MSNQPSGAWLTSIRSVVLEILYLGSCLSVETYMFVCVGLDGCVMSLESDYDLGEV